MPEISQYQTVFRIAKPSAPKRGQAPKRKPRSNGANSAQQNGGPEDDDNVSKAQTRLQKLEEMVTMLMQSNQGTGEKNGQLTPPSADSSTVLAAASAQPCPVAVASFPETSLPPPDGPSNGHLDVRGAETKYLGATHYLAILENIKDIQECLASNTTEPEDGGSSTDADEPEVLLLNAKALSLADVLGSLPPRYLADRYLSMHFHAKYLHIPFIHKGKFLREYELFWRDPSSVSFLWISMLFSALHLGCAISQCSQGQESLQPGQKREISNDYLTRAAQALVTGRYQKARPYSVEATMLYAICRFFQKQDSDTEPWLMMGVAARLALRMGYHRDPRHLAHISPFEGEMRRRTFSTIQTFELLLSFQAGLPAIIHEQVCDTEPAGNLFDDDFDEFSSSIPPSRPATDPTPMLYYCYKERVARTFRKIARQALSPRLPAYQDVMQLDAELRQTHSEIPPSLVWRPLRSSIADETYSIMHRLNLELVYQKSVMINHRRYLSHDRSNPNYQYSREACIASSFQMLHYQAELHQATQPGGQLHKDQWWTSDIALHDFLLAGMIACLDLYESYRENKNKTMSVTDAATQAKKYDALRTSQEIGQTRMATSPDARRAASILAIMLSKIPRPGTNAQPTGYGDNNLASNISQLSARMTSNGVKADNPLHSASLNVPTSFNIPTLPSAELDLLAMQDLPSQEFIAAVFSDSEMLDWSILDQYIHEESTPVGFFDV